MAIEVGAKVSGKVSGITNFGAFVDLGDHKTGLVHISEVSNGFVKDIHDVLSVGDEVTVLVTNIGDDGKIGLSIKQAADDYDPNANKKRQEHRPSSRPTSHNNSSAPRRDSSNHRGGMTNNNRAGQSSGKESFDDMMSGFLKDSESRLSTLKHNVDGKRGGRGGRRS